MRFTEVAVTGGKGGVGKSTIAILLANKLRSQGKRVVLADLDVECPNDYLLLGQSLGKPIDFSFARLPKLDRDKCQKCGICVPKCRSHAIFQAPGQYPIFLSELCSGCGLCAHLCPFGAIKMEKVRTGKIYEKKLKTQNANSKIKSEDFYLVTGKPKELLEETGPVVTKTRQYAEELSQKVRADYLLLDTAAGMHCSVIRGLIGVDLVMAVTEPTPLGAHDLRLILQLTNKLGLPTQIVLNQADLGKSKAIEKIAKRAAVEIKNKILYSKKIVNAYSRGRLQEINIL